MTSRKARTVFGALTVIVVVAASFPGIFGFPGGVGDGNKGPSTCATCHGSAGTGTVTVTSSATGITTGDPVDITVTVTEPSLTGEGFIGVFLLKGPVGSGDSVTADGWTIVSDPSGNSGNYVERSGLATGGPVNFVWKLAAPPSAGDYSIYADVKHGGDGPATEQSDALAISVTPPGTGGSEPPAILSPSLPGSVIAGSHLNVSVRISDDKEGVQEADLLYRTPGSAVFTGTPMVLVGGTAMDGLWGGGFDVGQSPGTVELYITASDGTQEARSPSSGALTVAVAVPGVPEIAAPTLPASVETGSTVDISARITDSDDGVALAVLRYRLPGGQGYATATMALSGGTRNDGTWSVSVGAGPSPGALELWIEATDGTNDARSPASGFFTVMVASPPGPAIEVVPPGPVTYGSAPEVWAKISDGAGVTGVQARFRLESEHSYRTVDMVRMSGDDRVGDYSAVLPTANATGTWYLAVSAQNARAGSLSDELAYKVLPDLFVSGLKLSKKEVLVKQKAVVSAVIGNHGDRPVSGLTVHFLDLSYNVGDVRYIRIVTNLTVPANGQVELEASWVPMVDGKRNLAVLLNPDGKVEEGDPANDAMNTTATVVLEPGMGIRFPIPKPADLQIQVTVLVIGAAILGSRIFLWQYSANKKAEAARKERMSGRAAPGPKLED